MLYKESLASSFCLVLVITICLAILVYTCIIMSLVHDRGTLVTTVGLMYTVLDIVLVMICWKTITSCQF